MATERQKLIHLHGSARLTDATKLNRGEIAVTHAEESKNVELVVKNDGGALVYIPSRDYVDTTITALTTTLTEAKGEIDALQETVGVAATDSTPATGLVGKVAALEAAVGNSDGESLGSRVDVLEETVNDAESGVAANAEKISALQTAVNAINEETLPLYVMKDDANPGAVASTGGAHVDVTVTQVNGKITSVAVTEDFSGITESVSGLNTKVNTLIGSDADKSVRTIANEELATQLLSGEADADFKTLQELAAWLEDHPESVAEINAAITELEKTVTGYTSGNTIATAIAGVKATAEAAATQDALEAAQSALTTEIGKKVAQTDYDTKMGELDGSISGLTTSLAATESKAASALSTANGAVQKADATATVASNNGDYVNVTVAQFEGKITGVTVSENFEDFATANELAGVKATAEGAVQDVAISGLTGVFKSESNSVVTFDFSNISIDCGEY